MRSNNSKSSNQQDEKALKIKKRQVRKESLKITTQWSKYSILLPLVPVFIVWGISCFLTKIINWEPFRLYEDFVLLASGVCVSALGVLDSKLGVGTRREHKRLENISRVTYVSLLGVYIIVYGKGLSNPTLALIISKQENTIKVLFIITVIAVIIQSIIVFIIEYKAKMEEGDNLES